MSKCGNCCYGVMTGPNRMFCSAQNCFCEEVFYCEDYEPIVKPQTNADRIRSMTDEELATRIKCPKTTPCIHLEDDYPCVNCKLDWLREEYKSEN